MEKTRRDFEENKRISVASITILVIIFVTWLFILIFLLYARSENEKTIVSINNEKEALKLDTSVLNEKKEEINALLDNVENSTTYMNIQKENYISSLPSIESNIKSFETEEKVAYLCFVVDNTNNIDNVIEKLNNNKVLATFYTNDKDAADKIISSGNLIGLYIDNEKTVANFKEEYKEIIDAYNPDLYMVSDALKNSDINIDSFYKVVENSTSEGKKLINKEGYINDVVDTTADRDFLVIKINLSNAVGVSAIEDIIIKLSEKNYIFLPLISSSSVIKKIGEQ